MIYITFVLLLLLPNISVAQGWNIQQIGSIYNNWEIVNSIKVENDFAYLTTGDTGFRILDVSVLTSPLELGYFDSSAYTMDGADITNGIAYVGLQNEEGLVILDISNPCQPEFLDYFSAAWSARCILITDSTLLVGTSTMGLRIFNIAVPQLPQELSFIDSISHVQSMALKQNILYCCGSEGLFLAVDISDPSDPHISGACSTSISSLHIALFDTIATVACYTAGVQIIDISEPEIPSSISWCSISGSAHSVVADTGYAYVSDGPNGNVLTISLSNLYNPQVVNSVEIGEYAKSLYLTDSLLFVTDCPQGLVILNISDPLSVYALGNYLVPPDTYHIFNHEGCAYLAAGRSGVKVLNTTDPANLVEFSRVNTRSIALSSAKSDNFLFVADYDSGMYIADVSDPAHPTEVNYLDTPGIAQGITVSDQYAYIADGSIGGLRIVDISDPYLPVEISSLNTPWDCYDLTVSDDYAYIADGEGGLRIVNVSNPILPYETGCILAGMGEARSVAVDDPYAYVVGTYGRTYVIDVSDPYNPFIYTEFTSSTLGNYGSDVQLSNNYAYVACVDRGCSVLNIASPDNIFEVGYFDSPGIAYTIDNIDSYALLGDAYQLLTLDCSDALPVQEKPHHDLPTQFTLYPAFPNPFNNATTLAFSLIEPGCTNLSLYDLSGRWVETLVDAWRPAGIHRLQWNATDCAAGIYFVQLKSNQYETTHKIVLLK